MRQGPMMPQTKRKCADCGGDGFRILYGKKEITKTGTVHIPRGITNGEKIVLDGEGHNFPENQNGDVTFVVRLKKHKMYHRKGADLRCQQTLTLCQALCGYEFRLKHLSGKTLIVRSQPGEIVQPGDLKVLSDYGLPIMNRFHHGHLYIQFKILLPLALSLPSNQMTILKSTLKKIKYPIYKGCRIKVHLNAEIAKNMYGFSEEMTAYGIIANELRVDGESKNWPVELDPVGNHKESKLAIVPAEWVKADEGNKMAMNEDLKEHEEQVFVETVVGDPPKPTPAQGGSINDDDADEGQRGGGGT